MSKLRNTRWTSVAIAFTICMGLPLAAAGSGNGVGGGAGGDAVGDGCTPPANETCENAIIIDGGHLPYVHTGPLGCVNDIVDKPYMDVFFRFDNVRAGVYTFDMCDSSGDTYIRVYTDGCGWSKGNELAVDDDSCAGSPPNADPELTVTLDAATSYWVEVGTWRPDPPWAPPPNSPYTLRVTAELCAGDVDMSGTVSFADILAVIAAWGPCAAECPADLSGNGIVDFADILEVIANWGPCAG